MGSVGMHTVFGDSRWNNLSFYRGQIKKKKLIHYSCKFILFSANVKMALHIIINKELYGL